MCKASNVLTLLFMVNTTTEENRTQFQKEVVNTVELAEKPTPIPSLGCGYFGFNLIIVLQKSNSRTFVKHRELQFPGLHMCTSSD